MDPGSVLKEAPPAVGYTDHIEFEVQNKKLYTYKSIPIFKNFYIFPYFTFRSEEKDISRWVKHEEGYMGFHWRT